MDAQRLQELLNRAQLFSSLAELQKQIPVVCLQDLKQGSLRSWTTRMVEDLARAARLDPAVVWSSDPLPAVPDLLFLRGLWPDFDHRDFALLAEALERAARLRCLAAELEPRMRPIDEFQQKKVGSRPHIDGYRLARVVRKGIGNLDERISSLYELAGATFDIQVEQARLFTKRLQAVTLRSQEGIAIVLNDFMRDGVAMQRRSIAHELCHALFDPKGHDLDAVIEGEDDEATTPTDPREQRARAFAAELLVPLKGLERLLGRPATISPLEAIERVARVADEFGAPPELAAHHLVNHGYVDRTVQDWLVQQVRPRIPCIDDPPRSWLRGRVLQAIDAGLISSQRGRELLGLSPYESVLPHDLAD